jgi:hypothetical protein
MKTFMMIFRFEPDFSTVPTAEDLEKQKASWGDWIGSIAQSGKLVDTQRFAFSGTVVNADNSTKEGFYAPENKMVSGYLSVKDVTETEAIALSKGCPILQMGGFVEVREISPM